jgi:hypothetical protein
MSKEDFVISIVYKDNTYSMNICEMFFLWDDICLELVRVHNLAHPDNEIEEDDALTLSDFDLTNVPKFITDYVADNHENWDELFSTYYSDDFYHDIEVLEAGIDCRIDLDSIIESYSGNYDSDADFAEQTVTDTYDINFEPSWLVIDWEQTAVNLMYDYSESNGHYFNNYY